MNASIGIRVLDGFFAEPESLLAKSNECVFEKSTGRYPGKRTKKLSICAPEVNSLIYEKLSLYNLIFPKSNLHCYFQKIEELSFDGNPFSIENSGWIHNDDAIISGIIYLNLEQEQHGGTSFFETLPADTDHGIDINYFKYEHYAINDVSDKDSYRRAKQRFTSLFKETVNVSNVFNRAVIFDASIWHAANIFTKTKTKPRLSLVFFIKQ